MDPASTLFPGIALAPTQPSVGSATLSCDSRNPSTCSRIALLVSRPHQEVRHDGVRAVGEVPEVRFLGDRSRRRTVMLLNARPLSVAAREWGGPVSRCPRCASAGRPGRLLTDLDGPLCLAHGHVNEPLDPAREAALRREMDRKLSEGRGQRGRYHHHARGAQLSLF